jgi:Fes/CIP4/EFC/F-BAR domain-containing protein
MAYNTSYYLLILNFLNLQDQYDCVSQHTQKGLEFLERYGHFLRDRASIEVEYAGKLRYIYTFSHCKIYNSNYYNTIILILQFAILLLNNMTKSRLLRNSVMK